MDTLEPMTADEAAAFQERGKLEALLARLEPARCYSDQYTAGTRATKWLHLSPADLDLAKEVLRDRIRALKTS